MTKENTWEESESYKRVISAEQFFQHHGFLPYEGETIQEFFAKAIDQAVAEERRRVSEAVEKNKKSILDEWESAEKQGNDVVRNQLEGMEIACDDILDIINKK